MFLTQFRYKIDVGAEKNMTVLEKIDELRRERGWSINNLAMEAMLTQSTLNNLYARGAEPKLSTLRAICGAFGITLSEFFAENEDADDELLRRVRALSPAQKQGLLALLRGGN